MARGMVAGFGVCLLRLSLLLISTLSMLFAIGIPKSAQTSDPTFWVQAIVVGFGLAALWLLLRIDWIFGTRHGFDLMRWLRYAFIGGSRKFYLRAGFSFILIWPVMNFTGVSLSAWALPGWCLGQLALSAGYFRVLQRLRRVRISAELKEVARRMEKEDAEL
ncbi:MAG: hypothetical protein WCK51_07185 [Armatimonadota bacterium]